MTTSFTVDDAAPLPGKRAIYFAREHDYSYDCHTLGYACTVIGQIRPSPFEQGAKRFLVYVDFLDATVIANESELAPCKSNEAPPIQSQGEVVIAWTVPEVEIVGAYRTNRWVPFSGFRFRAANVPSLQHQRWNSEEGGVTLVCETPSHLELDIDLVISVLGSLANQRCWRILPELP